METLHFSILIQADKQKVWHKMLDKATYTNWTTAFHEGSYFEGNWEQGTDIRFLAKNEDGNMQGMYSKIRENRKYEFVSIEHVGFINNGSIDTTSEEVKKWTPSFENYTFTEKGNATEVRVDVDVASEYADMFKDMWPKALDALKKISEA